MTSETCSYRPFPVTIRAPNSIIFWLFCVGCFGSAQWKTRAPSWSLSWQICVWHVGRGSKPQEPPNTYGTWCRICVPKLRCRSIVTPIFLTAPKSWTTCPHKVRATGGKSLNIDDFSSNSPFKNNVCEPRTRVRVWASFVLARGKKKWLSQWIQK